MNQEIAIRIKELSKKFTIGKQKDGSLRGSLANLFSSKSIYSEDFWALKDVSFDVQRGDVIGIIGKNGAGKSTLLKILSEITKPTKGRIEINGRVASLLEVGTGFHPELTGRENVYLNGTILGMTRKEVKAKFDEIVSFSGVEKFIDTPVKHYSSGMYVRLAFAVAAHLEPEILVIDEVLAVGDAEFQKKCLGKMQDVAKNGRTVLFVSHDIEAIATLCTKGVLLAGGKVKKIGSIQDVIKEYTNHFQDSFKVWDRESRPGDNIVRLNKIYLISSRFEQIYQVHINEKFGVRIEFEVFEDNVTPTPNFHFYTTTNICCFVAISDTVVLNKGKYQSTVWIPPYLLNNQVYTVGIAITTLKNVHIHLYEKEIINIEVIENKSLRESEYGGQIPGTVRPILQSETILIN